MLLTRLQQAVLAGATLLLTSLVWGRPPYALDMAGDLSSHLTVSNKPHSEAEQAREYAQPEIPAFRVSVDDGRPEMEMNTDTVLEVQPPAHTPPVSPSTASPEPKAIAFWNIFANGTFFRHIVLDQANVLEATGLWDRLAEVRFVAMGPSADMVAPLLKNPKFKQVKSVRNGSESSTQVLVWEHCKQNPQDRVLYFHNKGSKRIMPKNRKLRQALDCFVLNPGCLDALDRGYDTCGMRISPQPHLHHPGNFWWAKCTHVNQLIDPRSFEKNETFVEDFHDMLKSLNAERCTGSFVGADRWFAETWIGSLPDFKPADCIDKNLDTSYAYDYGIPYEKLRKVCPNFEDRWSVQLTKNRKWGGVCGNASMLANAQLFKNNMLAPQPGPAPDKIATPFFNLKAFLAKCASLPVVRARAKLWYGQDADLMVRWRALFGQY